ncbi:hypothetical protein DFH27DRAFT_82446 [Peziza echinospora]|nr:hypothetical protein DFH27DRAFT_82446 [Peziza echinospora]
MKNSYDIYIQELLWQHNTHRIDSETLPSQIRDGLTPIEGAVNWLRHDAAGLRSLTRDEVERCNSKEPSQTCSVLYCKRDGYSAIPYDPYTRPDDNTYPWWGLAFEQREGEPALYIDRNDKWESRVVQNKIIGFQAPWFQLFNGTYHHQITEPCIRQFPRLRSDLPCLIWALAAFQFPGESLAGGLMGMLRPGEPGVLITPHHERLRVQHGRAFVVKLWAHDRATIPNVELE